ncbi:unnamed protein product [Symbiodinium necroappetens]|uniref:Uncharacterized protein n=1 Tax=Symbiodinium necroappetens TaxID=1628268 RepID=A0A812VIG5_9DINO|nr:unnamed protein product [Symbiodinium necroappetens]
MPPGKSGCDLAAWSTLAGDPSLPMTFPSSTAASACIVWLRRSMSFTETANIQQLDGSHVNMTDRTKTGLCRLLPINASLISQDSESGAAGVPGPTVNSCSHRPCIENAHFCLTLAMVETELRNSLPGQSLLVPCDRQLKMSTQGLCVSSTVCDVKGQGNTQEMSLDGTSKFEKLLDKSAEGPSSLQGRHAKLEQLEQSLAATSKLLPNVLEDGAEKPDPATLQKTVKLPSSTRSPPGTLKEALSVLKEAAGISGVQLTEVPDLKGADETKTLKGIAGEAEPSSQKAVNQDDDLDSSLMEASKVEEPSTSFQASGNLPDAEVAELRALLETAIQESGSEVALDDDRTVKFEDGRGRVAAHKFGEWPMHA